MDNVNDGASRDPWNGSERGAVQTSSEIQESTKQKYCQQKIGCGEDERSSEGPEGCNDTSGRGTLGVAGMLNTERERDDGDARESCEDDRRREQGAGRREGISEHIEHLVATALDNEVSEDEISLLQRAEEWSGLLPDPDSFARYPRFVQEKMIAWNDAQILDESSRSDRLTLAAISQAKASLFLSGAIQIFSLLAAFIAFIITESSLSFGFLTVPVATIVINVAIKVRRGRRKRKRRGKRARKSKHHKK